MHIKKSRCMQSNSRASKQNTSTAVRSSGDQSKNIQKHIAMRPMNLWRAALDWLMHVLSWLDRMDTMNIIELNISIEYVVASRIIKQETHYCLVVILGAIFNKMKNALCCELVARSWWNTLVNNFNSNQINFCSILHPCSLSPYEH